MAIQNDSFPDFPSEHRNSKFYGQEKREEVGREEARPRHAAALNTSNSLHPKMIELLDELAVVEKEIHRLENQIKELKSQPKHEKQARMDSSLQEWELANLRNLQQEPPSPDPCNDSKRANEKATIEMKALHFITKAIKGDYNLSDFSLTNKPLNSKRFSNPNAFQYQVLRRPSPLRDAQSRHLTPKKDRPLELTSGLTPKVVSTPLHHEKESIHKWPPNKLSENIMRCLISIFLRLLRTTRATVETDFSLSFRADTGINAKSFPKESRQQDPYGIFESKESLLRDIGPYKNFVRFTSSSMDLKCIHNSASVPLFHQLKSLMDGLEKVDLSFMSHRQKLAFWINMYNACIMHGFLEYGISSVSSPEKMLTLINLATLDIGGNTINAQTIERFILRKPFSSQEKQILGAKEMLLHHLYGLKSSDPNIIFALCCGTRSSPAVRIYTAEGMTAELERSKQEYLQAAIVVTNTKRIAIPELLLRNMFDFGQDVGSLLEWLSCQLPASGSLRKSIIDCFRRVHGGKASALVEMIPYEFEFQYLFAV